MDGGRTCAHISFIQHEQDVDATLDVAVRFDAVENLANRWSKLLSNREKAATFTLGAELGNLERGEPFRVTLGKMEDVEGAVDALIAKFEKIGLPYLEQCSRPESAYGLLSKDTREGWINSPINWERAKRACALLAVMGRYSEIDNFGQQKLSFLESVNDPARTFFAQFLAELKDSLGLQ
jgi:hypothetical protein